MSDKQLEELTPWSEEVSKCLQKLKCSKTLASSKDDASVN